MRRLPRSMHSITLIWSARPKRQKDEQHSKGDIECVHCFAAYLWFAAAQALFLNAFFLANQRFPGLCSIGMDRLRLIKCVEWVHPHVFLECSLDIGGGGRGAWGQNRCAATMCRLHGNDWLRHDWANPADVAVCCEYFCHRCSGTFGSGWPHESCCGIGGGGRKGQISCRTQNDGVIKRHLRMVYI